jgi:hypothetical protein
VGLQVVPKQGNSGIFCLFELSECGALYMSEFLQHGGMEVDSIAPVIVELSAEVKSLRQSLSARDLENGLLERQHPFAEHVSSVYRGNFSSVFRAI